MVTGVPNGYEMSQNPQTTARAISLQFYKAVAPLVNELGRAMAVALDQGHATMLVVTDATRQMLEEQLIKRGIDVGASRRRGQYVFLDGLRTLEKCVADGESDPARFEEIVGRPVERLVREYPGVWMYGELAAILWAEGHPSRARWRSTSCGHRSPRSGPWCCAWRSRWKR